MPGAVEIERRRPGPLAWAPWIVVVAGACVMMVLFVIAVAAYSGYSGGAGPNRSRALTQPRWQSAGPPIADSGSSAPGTPSAVATTAAAVETAGAPSAAPTPAHRPRPPSASAVPGRAAPSRSAGPQSPVLTTSYRVRDIWGGSFIGELRIGNPSGAARSWTASLSFPAGVGDLRLYQVDGRSQPTLRRTGDRYVFTGSATLAPGTSLRLQMWFHTATEPRPLACSVNGAGCDLSGS